MRVKILGAAAGGGFPQWNCGCSNCRGLRLGSFKGSARTQAQLAIHVDGPAWTLLNASPDIRFQIESTPELWPQSTSRDSPISSIVLTSAELDQTLGVLLLREFQPLTIYATPSVRKILTEDNSMFAAMQRVPGQVTWTDIAPGANFSPSPGLCCETFSLPEEFPGWIRPERARALNASEASLGVRVSSNGGKLACFPAMPRIEDKWLDFMEQCDVVLLDGTFWSDDEPVHAFGSAKTARQMGHLPVSGKDGALDRLAALKRPRKIFFHINNTNPMLDEAGPEYTQIREAGWELGADGMEFEL